MNSKYYRIIRIIESSSLLAKNRIMTLGTKAETPSLMIIGCYRAIRAK